MKINKKGQENNKKETQSRVSNVNKSKLQIKPQLQAYQNDFEQIADDSTTSHVQKAFNIDYQTLSYEQIEDSSTKMRDMMKNISSKLDQKIHKYYGLMGLKHKPNQINNGQLINNLQNELKTHQKLIKAQEQQIKQIQKVDEQMASSKRIQKQAQRLRQYFQTKKTMIQAEKQTRYTKGEVSKSGDYLARDLDIDKQHFKLNKIKQDLEYAMLKQKGLIKRQNQLDNQTRQIMQKAKNCDQNYQKAIIEAQNMNILVENNKDYYNQFHKKKNLIKTKQQLKTKLQIFRYNNQSNLYKLFSEVQILKKQNLDYQNKKILIQSQIQLIQNSINQLAVNSGNSISNRIEQSITIKNIVTLLKKKQQNNSNMFLSSKNQNENSTLPVTMTESLIFLKPNFKIKPFLLNSRQNTKLKLGKSVDLIQNRKNSITQNQKSQIIGTHKSVLKWKRNKSNKSNIQSFGGQWINKLNKVSQNVSKIRRSKININPQQLIEEINN